MKKNTYKPYQRLCFIIVHQLNEIEYKEVWVLVKRDKTSPILLYDEGREVFRTKSWEKMYNKLKRITETIKSHEYLPFN